MTKLFIALCVAIMSANATDTVSTFGAGSNILGAIDFFWPAPADPVAPTNSTANATTTA